jgi:hypothetical protein
VLKKTSAFIVLSAAIPVLFGDAAAAASDKAKAKPASPLAVLSRPLVLHGPIVDVPVRTSIPGDVTVRLSAGGRQLARVRRTVRQGGAFLERIRLGAGARRAAGRSGGVRVSVTVRAPGGATVSRSWTLALAGSARAAQIAPSADQLAANAVNLAARGDNYTCTAEKATDPAPPPPVPPHPSGTSIRKVEYAPLCETGKVATPRPSKTPMPKGPGALARDEQVASAARKRTARTSTIFQFDTWYGYANAFEWFPWTDATDGLWGRQSHERPRITTDDWHSISQLWTRDTSVPGGYNSHEVGWRVREPNGWPRLFAYRFEQGVPKGYPPAGGWVSTSATVVHDMVLAYGDQFHLYGTQRSGSNWWFNLDGVYFGRYPSSAYNYFNAGILLGEAGGEVASKIAWTCADMGHRSRYYGTHPLAAMWWDVWRVRGGATSQYTNLTPNHTDPMAYDTGNWAPGVPGYQFRYGGPGYC